MKRFNTTDLNNLLLKLPFEELWKDFHPMRSMRGLKPVFTWQMLIKATILQWHLQIENDTDFSDYMSKNKDAVELCGMPFAPSHDVISKFTREHGNKFHILHLWFDSKLEEKGVFDNDETAGDGTNVILHKPQAKPDPDCFGAKSNKEKFYGLWLMLLVSVNTGLVRAFNVGKARIGQINLMRDLLISRVIKAQDKFFFDGIFDIKDIHEAVAYIQKSIPMITYNPKNSKCKSRMDLPYDDWRGQFNKDFKDGLWFIIESAKRVAVERSNSFLKMNTTLNNVYERSRRLQRKSGCHINKLIFGSVIMPQIDALIKIYSPKPITLLDYFNVPQEEKAEA